MAAIHKTYEVRVEEVHSGDDFILLVNLGVDGLFKRVRARLYGVDAPNAFKAPPDSEAGKVRDRVRDMVSGTCEIALISEGKGGWLITLYTVGPNGKTNINEYLKESGYVFRPVRRDNQ